MTVDRKRIYIISSAILAALLVTLFLPNGSGRILAAILLLPSAVISVVLIKKRVALQTTSKQVLLVISMIGLLYTMFYYLSALRFGFTRTGYGLKADIILSLTVPIAVIIVATEIIRHVLCAQKVKGVTVLTYFLCLVADVVIWATIPAITNMATFMDVIGLSLCPGILYNLLFNYLTVRYGYLPNIVYRLCNVWIFYLIPYGSAISNSLLSFMNLVLPIAIYFFIDSLYERKKRYALGNRSPFARAMSKILTAVVVILMAGTVMLVSNQFRYGALVIATESMTGELDKGDVVIFESHDDHPIIEGEVIVFEQSNSTIVHRVVDIKIINGNARYYTKGDANEDMDAGYITEADIVGHARYKLPFFGYPTLWIRSLFKR